MSNQDKCNALGAFIAKHPSELAELKSRLLYLVMDIEHQIERKRPGYLMDQLLGTKDRQINAGEQS